MNSELLRQVITSRRFALAEVILILVGGVAALVWPAAGMWFALLVLVLRLLRLPVGEPVPRRTPIDWLVAVFMITAWVGYWAAYNQTVAWSKVWFIVLGVLLYYALSTQPRENLVWISFILFVIGVGVSLYFLFTHDFVAAPRKLELVNYLGRAIMAILPRTGWAPIHPNYVAGTVAITVPFIFYPVGEYKKNRNQFPVYFVPLVIAGLLLAGLALLMATSRGVLLAILCGAGAWFIWTLMNRVRIGRWQTKGTIFALTILAYLCAIIAFLYAGPAQVGGAVIGPSQYGNGSRAELFSRSLDLFLDFPITGGGLGSFPGLFSQYILNIPFYYLPNSHNLFLDVAIEQGLIGGLAFLFLYIAGLWYVSRSLSLRRAGLEFQFIVLYALLAAMIHGMVDNYLYNGIGSMLSLFLVGLAANEGSHEAPIKEMSIKPVIAGGLAGVLILALVASWTPLRSMWYANLGAVQMAKVELDRFPDSEWAGSEMAPRLSVAEGLFRSAFQIDPDNRTANHRLGLIGMLQGDFETAADHLETAYKQTPRHRGILKALGYSYVWLGDFDRAEQLLTRIPEANHELENYVWWWGTQGRFDLSENASRMGSQLSSTIHQP